MVPSGRTRIDSAAGTLRQTRHGHDVARERDDEPGAGGRVDVADGEPEAGRSAQLGGIVGEGVLGLGDADRGLPEPHRLALGDVLLRGRRVVHAAGAVDLPRDGLDLLLDRLGDIVERLEGRFLLVEHGEDLARHRLAAFPALGPHLAQRRARAPPLGGVEHGLQLLLGVGGEAVERDHDRDAELLHVLHVGLEVHQPALERGHVVLAEGVLLHPAVHLERADRRHDDRRLRLELAEAGT